MGIIFVVIILDRIELDGQFGVIDRAVRVSFAVIMLVTVIVRVIGAAVGFVFRLAVLAGASNGRGFDCCLVDERISPAAVILIDGFHELLEILAFEIKVVYFAV